MPMRRGFVVLFVLALLGAVVPVGATTGPLVFVSTGSGRKILKIDGTTGGTATIYTGEEGFQPEDLVVGPDNKLYICAPLNNLIIRMDQFGGNVQTVYLFQTSGDPVEPQGPRFNAAGDLFFNTKGLMHSGIWKIPGVANLPAETESFPSPVQVLTADAIPAGTGSDGGEGLAFANNGDLLIVDAAGNKVLKSSDPNFTSALAIISGLDEPTGIARDMNNNIYIANGGDLNNIVKCNPDGTGCTEFVNFNTDRPFFLEFTLDNTLFVATTDASGEQGKLWRVDPSNEPTPELVKDLCGESEEFCGPAVGVAVEATSRTISQTFSTSNTTRTYDFGAFLWEMTNLQLTGTCTPTTVKATQTPPAEVNTLLAGTFTNSTVFTFKGEGGFATVFTTTQPGCFSGPTSIYVAAYIANPFNVNPKLILDFNTELQLERYDPRSVLPGDPGLGGRTNNFGSEFVLANRAIDPARAANFCGFQPPLRPNGPNIFEDEETLPVKFQLSTGNCKKNFVTDAQAIISVAKISPNYERKVATCPGHSCNPPFFRVAGKKYIFNLSLKGYTPGTYVLTVIFLTNDTTIKTIQFQVVDEDDHDDHHHH